MLQPDDGKLRFERADGTRAAVGTFSGLVSGGEYLVVVAEDKKEEAKLNASAYSAASGKKLGGGGAGGGFGRAVGGGTRGSALVTAELKKLTPEELREGGAKVSARPRGREDGGGMCAFRVCMRTLSHLPRFLQPRVVLSVAAHSFGVHHALLCLNPSVCLVLSRACPRSTERCSRRETWRTPWVGTTTWPYWARTRQVALVSGATHARCRMPARTGATASRSRRSMAGRASELSLSVNLTRGVHTVYF